MTFLQPIVLWGLPLVLLPVIIHLLNKLRHRPQPWAAMRFLILATRSSTGHAKLRQFLILLFRVLAVLALVLFVARPLAGGWIGWALAPAPDAVLILLDRSASMESHAAGSTKSKREASLELLSQAARPFEGKSHLILIDSASRRPQELPSASILSELPAAGPTDTAADLPAMIAAALRWIADNKAGNSELWIASDLQRSNWEPEDSRWKVLAAQMEKLPQKLRIRLLDLEQDSAPNKSVALRELGRRRGANAAGLEALLEIQSRAPAAESIPVVQNLNGNRSQTEVHFEGQSLRWRHLIDLKDQQESGWGAFDIPADANSRDNRIYFVYAADQAMRSSIVAADFAAGSFLRLAAAAAAGKPEAAAAPIRPSQFSTLSDESLLLWQGPLPSGESAAKVKKYIEAGGVALFFPPGSSDTNSFLGVSWGKTEDAPADQPFHPDRWDNSQGPLARSKEGFNLPLKELDVLRRTRLQGGPPVLASFPDGAAFLCQKNSGRGAAYFCASLPDPKWSSLQDGPVLVPMVQRCLQQGSRRLAQASQAACGEMSPAELARRWEAVDSPQPKDVRTQAGVYRAGDRLLAVNRPAAEDDLDRLPAEAARQLFGSLPVHLFRETRTGSDQLQGEIWRAVLFLMFLFLIGEAALILPPRIRAGTAAAPKPAFAAATAGAAEVKR